MVLRRRRAKARRKTGKKRRAQRQRRQALRRGFLCFAVLMPLTVFAYLAGVAVPQYYSYAGFTTRTSDAIQAPQTLASAIGLGIGGQATENDILFSYLKSPELVSDLDATWDLRDHYASGGIDPVFLLSRNAQLEDLQEYWARVAQIAYDPSTGLIDIRLRARDPLWARQVLRAVVSASERKINDINKAAYQDAVRYAQTSLAAAESDWRQARAQVESFRVRHGLVDPTIEIESRMGVMSSLQHQLAAELIDLDEMRLTTDTSDPRFRKLQDRVSVIRKRLAEERLSFSGKAPTADENFPQLVSAYEALSTDLEFAHLRYTTALSALVAAQAEAAQQSRYLAIYLEPTLAESSQFPRPVETSGLAFLVGLLLWAIFAMLYLSVRGRRYA